MSDAFTQINGVTTDRIAAQDRGLMYGHGLFETMRLSGGAVPLWSYHRQRLLADAERLYIGLDPSIIEHYLSIFLCRCPSQGVVRLTVTAGYGERGYRPAKSLAANYILQWFPPVAAVPDCQLQLCRYRLSVNPSLAGIKHLNRLDQVLASCELATGNEGLLLDDKGNVVEVLSGNIFWRSKGRWWTSDLRRAGVAGVMRRYLLTTLLAPVPVETVGAGITDIDLDTLAGADELFTCNAVRGVTWVRALLGEKLQLLRQWQDGRATQALREQLAERMPCFRH